MRTITLYRRDFKESSEEVDFFADICIELGLANSYDNAIDIDEIELQVEQAVIES